MAGTSIATVLMAGLVHSENGIPSNPMSLACSGMRMPCSISSCNAPIAMVSDKHKMPHSGVGGAVWNSRSSNRHAASRPPSSVRSQSMHWFGGIVMPCRFSVCGIAVSRRGPKPLPLPFRLMFCSSGCGAPSTKKRRQPACHRCSAAAAAPRAHAVSMELMLTNDSRSPMTNTGLPEP